MTVSIANPVTRFAWPPAARLTPAESPAAATVAVAAAAATAVAVRPPMISGFAGEVVAVVVVTDIVGLRVWRPALCSAGLSLWLRTDATPIDITAEKQKTRLP